MKLKTFENFQTVNENRRETVTQDYYNTVLNAFRDSQSKAEQLILKYARIESYTTDRVLTLNITTEDVSPEDWHRFYDEFNQKKQEMRKRTPIFNVSVMLDLPSVRDDEWRPIEIQIWSDF